MVHIDSQVNKNCWNLYDSYGEICVGCGCCQRDTRKRREARLAVLKTWLEESENFADWDDDPVWRERQEKNHRATIKHLKRQIRYYERRLREAR